MHNLCDVCNVPSTYLNIGNAESAYCIDCVWSLVICDHNSWIIQLNPALFCFLWVVSQIGMRTDSAIASVYDEDGKEIENSELLFMEEGVSKIQLCFINLQ